MGKLISSIQRRVNLILWFSLCLSIGGGYFTAKLYGNLRTDLEELLPLSSRSVRDLNEVTRRLKSIDNLAILVFSKQKTKSKKFIIDLAKKLESFPKNEITGIEYRIDHELEFFKKRQALYLDTQDLLKIKNYISKRIQYEIELFNPLNIFSEADIPVPELNFRSLQQKYEKRAQDYAHFPEGFFSTPDETKRVILIDVAGKTLGIEGVKNLKQRVEETIAKMHPRSYASDIEIHFTGSVEEMLEEQESLVEDLALSTVIVIFLVSFAMLLFFKVFWPTVALVVSLFAATLWTFGIAYFVVGYLNANSAFLGSIVLGNGINIGIIFLARYLEERRLGYFHLRSCSIAISSTWKATLTAGLAAGLSYGSLMLTRFRGFSQFGLIGLIGMTLCWVSSYTLLPSLLFLVEKFRPIRRQPLFTRKGKFTRILAAIVSRWPRPLAALSTGLTLLSIYFLSQANSGLLETNLEHLRSKKSVEKGAGFYSKDLNEIFHRFLTPLVVLPTSHEKSLEIAEKLKKLKQEEGPQSAIVSVKTIDDFIPKNQKEKIELLQEIKSELKSKILTHLSAEDRENAKILLSPEAFRPFGIGDLPPLIRSKFTEKDGSIGKLVLIEPPLSKDIWQGDALEKFIEKIRSAADSAEPGAPLAGGMAITADLVSSITQDGPRATLLAFLAVICLVIVLFRKFKTILLSLLTLLVGVSWFGGLIVLFGHWGLKINFLNFVALPITFGIGVDYGINIFQRYQSRCTGGIVQVIRETGGAVALCSLTTILGYSSLLMASNQGFNSFGLLAVLGELTCVTAALVALPSVLASLNSGPSIQRPLSNSRGPQPRDSHDRMLGINPQIRGKDTTI